MTAAIFVFKCIACAKLQSWRRQFQFVGMGLHGPLELRKTGSREQFAPGFL